MEATSTTETPIPVQAPLPEVVHAFVASPSCARDGLCFSARETGLWRSRDGGATWHAAQPPPVAGRPATTTAIAFSPHFADDRTLFAGAFGAILRSRDAGESWRAIPLPAPPPLVTCLAVLPAAAQDGVVLAGTIEDGVLRSADGGESWRRWNFGLLDRSVLALAISPGAAGDDLIFAGTETSLAVSENGGRSWTETPFREEAAPVLAHAVASGRAGTIWAGTERTGLWQSSDRGQSWQRVDRGEIVDAVNAVILGSGAGEAGVVLVALPEAALISRDDGWTWRTAIARSAAGGGIAAIAAPWGLGLGAPLLVGQRDGSVRRAVLDV
jgi:photosystem II stability/assembly factor-like uncharacterized protein